MPDMITIEEINNNTNALTANINNANIYAYNANTYAYNARANANACNQILSNVYYNNGATKKSWHFHDTNSTLNLTDVNGVLYKLSTSEANIKVELDGNTIYLTQRTHLVFDYDHESGLAVVNIRGWRDNLWTNTANTQITRQMFSNAFNYLQYNYVLNIRFSNLVTNGVVRATYSLYE